MTTKTRINRLRAVLKDHGYLMQKKHRGEDSWMIIDFNNVITAGYNPCSEWEPGLTLDEVEEWIKENGLI